MTELIPLYVLVGTLLLASCFAPAYLIWLAWHEKPTGRHLHH